jgi:hypothetical protein
MSKITKQHEYKKICDGCICPLINDPEIIISQDLFHNYICSFHYKYCKNNISDRKLYEETGRNFFVELVEFNLIKFKIRDETFEFLMEYLYNYFENK